MKTKKAKLKSVKQAERLALTPKAPFRKKSAKTPVITEVVPVDRTEILYLKRQIANLKARNDEYSDRIMGLLATLRPLEEAKNAIRTVMVNFMREFK